MGTLSYDNSSMPLLELALEIESDQHLNAYRLGGGNSGNHGPGHQGARPSGQEHTPKNALRMRNVQDLVCCDFRDEKGGLVHAPDFEMHKCFVVQGNKQDMNTRGKAKMPDHYTCTITCAFCGRCEHYEANCNHKQRLSAKLKSENSKNGVPNGKDSSDKGKGKSRNLRKHQEQGKGGRGGPDKKNEKNQDKSWGSPNAAPGGTNPEHSAGQQNTRPTTCSQTQAQAQQEQGGKRGNEDGDKAHLPGALV